MSIFDPKVTGSLLAKLGLITWWVKICQSCNYIFKIFVTKNELHRDEQGLFQNGRWTLHEKVFMFFLIWIKKFKNSLLFGGIQTTSSLVDYLSALFQAKVTFYWREKPFSKNNLIQFLSFWLNNYGGFLWLGLSLFQLLAPLLH